MLAQTLRVLHGQKDVDDQKDVDRNGTNKEQLRTLQTKSFDRLAKHLESSCAGVLKSLNPKETTQRTKHLNRILTTAGTVSFRLWAQGYKIACQSLGRTGKTFMRASPDMEPHFTMLLDDDDMSRDGQKVQLVVKPRIDAYGNDEGTYFGERRTLDPATVLLCGDRRERPDSPKNGAQELPEYRIGHLNEVYSSTSGRDLTANMSGVPYANSDKSLNGGYAGPDRSTAQVEAAEVNSSHPAPIAGLTGEMTEASPLSALSNEDSLSSEEMDSESIPSERRVLPASVQIRREVEIQQPTRTLEAEIKKTTQSQDQLNDYLTPAATKFAGRGSQMRLRPRT
jgi:hypothetical protein